MLAITEGQSQRKIFRTAPIEFGSQSDVAVVCFFKLPIHLEVLQICPAIACSHISARQARKGDACAHRHPRAALLRHENALSVGDGDIGMIACAADLEMGSTESIQLKTRNERSVVALNSCPLQQAGEVRIADDLFGYRVAAGGI